MAVYRVYVEKKSPFDVEAQGVLSELCSLLGIEGLTGLRLLNRYDVEGLDEPLPARCVLGAAGRYRPHAAAGGGRGVRRRVPARAVRPAR